VRIIRALHRSAEDGRPVRLAPFERKARPSMDQVVKGPAPTKPSLVHAEPPSGS